MKKLFSIAAILAFATMLMAGCGSSTPAAPAADNKSASKFDAAKEIHVVSREDGSGTRGAFIELMKIEATADGKKKDMTTKESIIANKTDVMLTNISGDAYAIGYVSLGSVNDSIKALSVDGVAATAENVKNKSYKVSRPFVVATKGDPTGAALDFLNFVMSKEGQAIIGKDYISVAADAKPYASAKPTGKLVIAGSSSVTPVMEVLVEAYLKLNKDMSVEIQMSDSTAGVKGAIDGTCGIGMASRELKDSEKAQLKPLTIAIDGIAVIVNKDNANQNITSENVKKIYTGAVTKWNEVK